MNSSVLGVSKEREMRQIRPTSSSCEQHNIHCTCIMYISVHACTYMYMYIVHCNNVYMYIVVMGTARP